MTDRWLEKSKIYKRFASEYKNLDFSEKAAEEFYNYESRGIGAINNNIFGFTLNGYAVGKKWWDVQVGMWLDNLKNPGWMGILRELYSCKQYPEWLLDGIFKKFLENKNLEYNEILKSEYFKDKVYKDFMEMRLAIR